MKFTRQLLGILLFFLFPIVARPQQASNSEQIRLHTQQAQKFLRANQPEEAITEYRAIVHLDPKNVDALGNLGVLLYFQHDYVHTIPELDAALKLRPGLWKIRALLGMSQRRTGNFSAAMTNLEKSFPKLEETKVQIEVGMELIEMYSGQGQLDKAARVVDLLRNKYPTDLSVLNTSYRIHSDLAGESMLSLSLVAPHSAEMYQVIAHELARQGQMKAAIRNYREALKINPNLPGLHFELAEALNGSDTQQEKEEAKKEYEAALAANNFDEKSECRLGTIAYQSGNLEGSLAHYSRALQLQPEDPEANLGLAKDLMDKNENQKAQALLENAVRQDPSNPEVHFRLSTIYRQEGRVEDAKRELDDYQKFRKMKEKLTSIYEDMRSQPTP